MIYYKNGNTTRNPIIPNVIRPIQEVILANGWFIYIDNPPAFDGTRERIVRGDVRIEGNEAIREYTVEQLSQEEIRALIVPQSITNGQGKLQLFALGIYEQVEAMIMQAGNEERIYWNDWDNWRRDSPIINRLAPMIWQENTDELLDQFFIEAAKIV